MNTMHQEFTGSPINGNRRYRTAAKLYGIFSGSKFALMTSKNRAIELALKYPCTEIRSVAYESSPSAWDSPTFKLCSELEFKSANLADIESKLESVLHGSGFDGGWGVIQLKNGNCRAEIAYHAMNERGFYDGWFVIRVVFNPANFEISRVLYSASRYLRRKYIQNECYYEDCIYDAFESLKEGIENHAGIC